MALFTVDSLGQTWRIDVASDGSMTTTPVAGTLTSSSSGLTTTVQNIIDGTAQDVRKILVSDGTDAGALTLLVDYCNRVSLQLLRVSRWKFLLSAPQHFVTEKEQTDYWVGTTGAGPTNVVDTGLSLVDFDIVKDGSVFDRSNFRTLLKTDEPPLVGALAYKDDTSRAGPPRLWRNSQDTPNVFNIYPAPDNTNTYQPKPESPVCGTAVAGALPARLYFVRQSFVDSFGNEGAASDKAQKVFVPANSVLLVRPPAEIVTAATSGVKYDRWNCYVGSVEGSETLQPGGPIAIGSTFTEPNGGVSTNGVTASASASSNFATVDGYVIEFRYFKGRVQLSNVGQVIQIPDEYKDVVIAGVNHLAFAYLKMPTDSQTWKQIYMAGIGEIIRDRNLGPHGGDFVRPDSAAVTSQLPGLDSFDFSNLRSN